MKVADLMNVLKDKDPNMDVLTDDGDGLFMATFFLDEKKVAVAYPYVGGNVFMAVSQDDHPHGPAKKALILH